MATKLENNEDESFIILGTSPGTSLDIKCNSIEEVAPLDNAQIEDAMKELSMEASYKAHFNLADCPSPASMMVASTMITEDKTTGELQKQFGELLDENVILKEQLEANNHSMKEQFLMVASCQEDMLKTHAAHQEKFHQTRQLIENLRKENKQLKLEISHLKEAPAPLVNGETGEIKSDSTVPKSGPSSALEFVTSPEDDTVDKLTAQLELVEKQRRQVITDNEKLTWQKESLEHIVDATTKERDVLKEKLKNVELQLSNKIAEHEAEARELNYTINELQTKLNVLTISPEEIRKRDAVISQLEEKVLLLQNDLKNAQLKVLEAENVKFEFAKHKSGIQEMTKVQKDQLQEMHKRLKEATTTVFQPVRLSVSADESQEPNNFAANVKLYDRTLKHLADLLNKLTYGVSDSLVETLGVTLSLCDFRLDKTTADQFRTGLETLKRQLETQQSDALANIGQVRGTLTIFEGIFKDYKELLDKNASQRPSGNIEALTSALVARGKDLQTAEAELDKLRAEKEDTELMKAQLELYRSDFEAERQAREKMASEKDSLHTDLRKTQRRNEELTQQLEEVRRLNPGVYRSATTKTSQPNPSRSPTAKPTTDKMVYTCPKCMHFSCDQYKVMEDHFDFCLDDF